MQNYVVNSISGETNYTPPPAHDVPILMGELVGWLGEPGDVHPVLGSGIAQFQLDEVKERGELVIRRDALARRHDLSNRQAVALGHVLEHGALKIGDFERLCPGTTRRTLQRDLKALVEKGLLLPRGSTNRLEYLAGSEAT